MDIDLEKNWELLLQEIGQQFGEEVDLQGLLFLIGIQELGKGQRKFSKDEKLDVMHIAICTLLSPYGYYELEGYDTDDWPHWKRNEKLPSLKPEQQSQLMKQAIIEYFKDSSKIIYE